MSGDVMDDVFEPMFEPMDRGSLEVIRRLEAYADVRLEPTVAASSRIRAAVMVAAHRRSAQLATDAMLLASSASLTRPAGLAPAARRLSSETAGDHRTSWLDAVAWRRPAAAILAGCLTLGVLAGTAFAVRPGGMLYQARIWTEAANLPGADQELARAQAEIQRLGARLDEAEAAAAAGDGQALAAALNAYAAIVTEAAAGTAGDPDAVQAVQLTIERHMLVLNQLTVMAPAPAQAALQHAILSSTEALDDIDGGHVGPAVNSGNGPATNNGVGPAEDGNNGVGPASENTNGAAGGTSASQKPDATPVPDPTATPRPPKPTATPGTRDRTPRPTATSTHQPPGQQGDQSSPATNQDQQ